MSSLAPTETWLPEGIQQSSPTPAERAAIEAAGPPELDSLQWSDDFWEETGDVGAELIRCDALGAASLNVFCGHFSQGKTALVQDLARQWIEQHGCVLWLDYETGSRHLRARLLSSGWGPQHRERWRYDYMPALTPEAVAAYVDAGLEQDGEFLLVVDSASAALMAEGKEENSATDAGAVWTTVLGPARDRGATVVAIEQVKQSATRSDRYPMRGTGAKTFAADVIWFVESPGDEIDPLSVVEVAAYRKKDKLSVLPEKLRFEVGDGKGAVTWKPWDESTAVVEHTELELRVRAQVLSHPDGLSTNQARQTVRGRNEKISDALTMWGERGDIVAHPQPNGGVLWKPPAPSDAPGLD